MRNKAANFIFLPLLSFTHNQSLLRANANENKHVFFQGLAGNV